MDFKFLWFFILIFYRLSYCYKFRIYKCELNDWCSMAYVATSVNACTEAQEGRARSAAARDPAHSALITRLRRLYLFVLYFHNKDYSGYSIYIFISFLLFFIDFHAFLYTMFCQVASRVRGCLIPAKFSAVPATMFSIKY